MDMLYSEKLRKFVEANSPQHIELSQDQLNVLQGKGLTVERRDNIVLLSMEIGVIGYEPYLEFHDRIIVRFLADIVGQNVVYVPYVHADVYGGESHYIIDHIRNVVSGTKQVDLPEEVISLSVPTWVEVSVVGGRGIGISVAKLMFWSEAKEAAASFVDRLEKTIPRLQGEDTLPIPEWVAGKVFGTGWACPVTTKMFQSQAKEAAASFLDELKKFA